MSNRENELDLEQALLDPGAVFASPEALRDHAGLTRAQKIELLRRWAYDASELAVAEEEGIQNGEDMPLVRVLSVLHELTGVSMWNTARPQSRKVCRHSKGRHAYEI